jgi:hypothetical protein
MKTLLVALGIVALVGCGSNDSGSSTGSTPSLIGTWLDAPNSSEAVELTFTASTWQMKELASLTNGTNGVQIDAGTYTLSGSALTMLHTSSSCKGISVTLATSGTNTVSRQGNSLTLTSSATLTVWQLETAPPAGMGGATIGCFDSSGNFTPNPVGSLQ